MGVRRRRMHRARRCRRRRCLWTTASTMGDDGGRGQEPNQHGTPKFKLRANAAIAGTLCRIWHLSHHRASGCRLVPPPSETDCRRKAAAMDSCDLWMTSCTEYQRQFPNSGDFLGRRFDTSSGTLRLFGGRTHRDELFFHTETEDTAGNGT